MPGNWRHKTDLFNLEAMAKYGRHLPNMEGFSFVCFYGGKSSRWILTLFPYSFLLDFIHK